MYPANRLVSLSHPLNGAGLYRLPDHAPLAATALSWCQRFDVAPVELFVAPLEVAQKSYSVPDNSMLGAGLPARSIRLAERHLLMLAPAEQESLVAHEWGHLACEHGRRPWYLIKENQKRNHSYEYQADGVANYLTGCDTTQEMLRRIVSEDVDDTFFMPAVERRISRLEKLGDLSHIPDERLLAWVKGNIRA